ncbi:ATP-binding protein [Actinacidiphila epipremni]|uniref:ATP-binding protein n=1 Tax=Actinacidiphila epipremni TaxID=2053013 RepID=A0ABX0ZP36_9ACTN|nr:ATP-binding protein [Actinacidiphila epipremni]NJP44049.1 ATP-binding protein [Actinacidiphila epipremni]
MTAERYVSTLELDARAEATPWARRHVRDVLSAWNVAGACIDTTELAVCELVSNAVQHVAPDAPHAHVTLTLRHDESQLIAEVADPSDRPPVADTTMSEDTESGRGLFIVGEISKEWDYYLLPTGGKVVWCTIALTG